MQSKTFSSAPYFEIAGYKDDPSTAYCDPDWDVQVVVEMVGRLGDAEFLKRLPTKVLGQIVLGNIARQTFWQLPRAEDISGFVKLLYECEVEHY
jgi:hypothetical protein